MGQATQKILLVRFSSIGDVTQCLSVPTRLKELSAEIHWVTRSDVAILLQGHPAIDRIWSFDRREGIPGLFRLISALRHEKFTHVYDAHNNLRSKLIGWGLRLSLQPPRFLRRDLQRFKRFMLLKFHRNLFRMPFSGQRDFLEPLKAWGLSEQLPRPPQIFCGQAFAPTARAQLLERGFLKPIGLVPSAAFELKRWPLENFLKLIEALPQEKFLIFGGPGDDFVKTLAETHPERVWNLAGKLSLAETTAFADECQLIVANDTGVLHIAEQLGKPAIALMGPAPFGFPSRSSTHILERQLACRPCSKHGQGPCVNANFQQCLRDISVAEVRSHVLQIQETAQ